MQMKKSPTVIRIINGTTLGTNWMLEISQLNYYRKLAPLDISKDYFLLLRASSIFCETFSMPHYVVQAIVFMEALWKLILWKSPEFYSLNKMVDFEMNVSSSVVNGFENFKCDNWSCSKNLLRDKRLLFYKFELFKGHLALKITNI